jgi:hypothetical protein
MFSPPGRAGQASFLLYASDNDAEVRVIVCAVAELWLLECFICTSCACFTACVCRGVWDVDSAVEWRACRSCVHHGRSVHVRACVRASLCVGLCSCVCLCVCVRVCTLHVHSPPRVQGLKRAFETFDTSKGPPP